MSSINPASEPDDSSVEQIPNAEESANDRRDFLRLAASLGLGHMAILAVGSPVGAKPKGDPQPLCGYYTLKGELVHDANCGQPLPETGNPAQDNDCSQPLHTGDPLVAGDNDCGVSFPSGGVSADSDCGLQSHHTPLIHVDNDCGLTQQGGSGTYTDQDCGKIDFTGRHDDNS